MNLMNMAVPAAVANATTKPIQWTGKNLALQANLVYGSGGTSADFYVQTTLDGGQTWIDIAEFHYLLAGARKVFNLSPLTPVTTEYTPTDGSLAADTAKDGIIGTQLRVKYTIVGTYAGSTISIDASSPSLNAPN